MVIVELVQLGAMIGLQMIQGHYAAIDDAKAQAGLEAFVNADTEKIYVAEQLQMNAEMMKLNASDYHNEMPEDERKRLHDQGVEMEILERERLEQEAIDNFDGPTQTPINTIQHGGKMMRVV